MVKVIAQRLRPFIKLFHKAIDVVLLACAVQTTLIERRIERRPKTIGLLLDLTKCSFYFLVGDPIRNTGDSCSGRRENLGCSVITAAPTPLDVISRRQLVQITLQSGPVVLSLRRKTIAAHEIVDACGAIEYGF